MATNLGTFTVTGSATQVESAAIDRDRKVKTITFKARSGNGAPIYLNTSSGVASSDGWELEASDILTFDYEEGSETWGNFWAISGSGSSAFLDWALVFED